MRYIPSRFGTGLGGALGRCLTSSTLSTRTVHMVNESIGNSVHVALDLDLASKAITAMGPTDAHRPMLPRPGPRRSLQRLSIKCYLCLSVVKVVIKRSFVEIIATFR